MKLIDYNPDRDKKRMNEAINQTVGLLMLVGFGFLMVVPWHGLKFIWVTICIWFLAFIINFAREK